MLCAYKRPRYQVSVYRTIGPLVCISSELERISTIICELKRIFVHCSTLNLTHESEFKRPESNSIRMHANNYEPGI